MELPFSWRIFENEHKINFHGYPLSESQFVHGEEGKAEGRKKEHDKVKSYL
jgi:hypothetical protein